MLSNIFVKTFNVLYWGVSNTKFLGRLKTIISSILYFCGLPKTRKEGISLRPQISCPKKGHWHPGHCVFLSLVLYFFYFFLLSFLNSLSEIQDLVRVCCCLNIFFKNNPYILKWFLFSIILMFFLLLLFFLLMPKGIGKVSVNYLD